MLTEAQKLAREGKLTASRVACLMTGDKAKIIQLWREMIGDPTYVEENLDDVWAIQLGSITEQLNLDWYEKITQRTLIRRGMVCDHPDYDWAAATLDGFDLIINGPVETKHVGGFEKFDVVLQRYMPQTHWQMECTKTRKCVLSLIEGARKPRIEIIEYNKEYADELMARALRFMEHVYNLTEPVILDPVEFKTISRLVDYNYTGNNHWAAYANDWLSNKMAADKFEVADDALRAMLPNDAASVSGHGIIATRDRANRVRIKDINAKTTKGKTSSKNYTRTK